MGYLVYCPTCGAKMSNNARSCPSCGENHFFIRPEPYKVKCIKCNGTGQIMKYQSQSPVLRGKNGRIYFPSEFIVTGFEMDVNGNNHDTGYWAESSKYENEKKAILYGDFEIVPGGYKYSRHNHFYFRELGRSCQSTDLLMYNSGKCDCPACYGRGYEIKESDSRDIRKRV